MARPAHTGRDHHGDVQGGDGVLPRFVVDDAGERRWLPGVTVERGARSAGAGLLRALHGGAAADEPGSVDVWGCPNCCSHGERHRSGSRQSLEPESDSDAATRPAPPNGASGTIFDFPRGGTHVLRTTAGIGLLVSCLRPDHWPANVPRNSRHSSASITAERCLTNAGGRRAARPDTGTPHRG